ncbi:MAG: SDR family oxidoreductase [Deltaproteobacteria bacterium]|nr:SDR family oxidoreductase [Deltaproteobacteria bacterium]
MRNKVVLVTGGSTGIGLATAKEFAKREATVVIAGRNQKAGDDAVWQIINSGGNAVYHQTDISDSTSVFALFDFIKNEFGRLNFAFNNAGYFPGLHALAEYTEEMWDKTMSVNAKGTWLCLKQEIPLMLESGGGAIVNCSSIASLVGIASHYAYTASKCAVDGLTRVSAVEFAKSGIRVNAVCPGVIETSMVAPLLQAAREEFTALHPVGRVGQPHEIAKTVLWLCSDESSFITGQILPVDGGWSVP